jgi:hypothetical protein
LGIPLKLITSILKGIIVQELNHFMDEVNLLGCVSIPKANFNEIKNQDLNEMEIGKYFHKIPNGREVLQKSFHLLDKKKNMKKIPFIFDPNRDEEVGVI